MRTSFAVALRASLAILTGAFAAGTGAVEVVGKVTHPELGEISGLAKSSDGSFYWVHNDSGDSARLFAIDAEGNVIGPSWMNLGPDDWPGHTIDNAWHFDWESIAVYEGHLYVADVGNNGNARRDLGIYRLAEPNPHAVTKARAHGFLEVVYPDQAKFPAEQWHFDCEAVFVDNGFIYLITKHREAGRINVLEAGAKLYRVRAVLFAGEAELLGSYDNITSATGADLSPDGDTLAVSSYTALWLFDRPAEGDNWFEGPARKLVIDPRVTKQLEAIAWEDAETLLLINEQRDIMRAKVAEFEAVD
ncbi:MAG: hypothetical protein F4Y26_02510 [Gammaproteobacteria bacterium]|nr:hypothetical protein [Gammaproteobacteria bacterium]